MAKPVRDFVADVIGAVKEFGAVVVGLVILNSVLNAVTPLLLIAGVAGIVLTMVS